MSDFVVIGYDQREQDAFEVAIRSTMKHAPPRSHVYGLELRSLCDQGLYYRPTTRKDGRLHDVISDAPMSTEFAISRFLTPFLVERLLPGANNYALFMDSDVLVRDALAPLFLFARGCPEKAVLCVQHQHNPPEGQAKMDGQVQVRYARKNWSSVMIFNCDHPANKALTVDLINSVPGRDLHRFCWLKDEEIGALHVRWNWLVGHSPADVDPAIVHFTEGVPSMIGYENAPYADEWRTWLRPEAQEAAQ